MIGSQTRAWILKSLSKRRYTISELSRLLKLSKPTILYHLKILERSGYVRKLKNGRKWRYYELTDLGRSLAKILAPIAVIMAIIAVITRVEKMRVKPEFTVEKGVVPSVQRTPVPAPTLPPKPTGGFPWIELIGILVAIAVVSALILIHRKRKR